MLMAPPRGLVTLSSPVSRLTFSTSTPLGQLHQFVSQGGINLADEVGGAGRRGGGQAGNGDLVANTEITEVVARQAGSGVDQIPGRSQGMRRAGAAEFDVQSSAQEGGRARLDHRMRRRTS